jgi:outer membrane protein OmpU
MKNNNKGEIMNNLKKVGLTALAGSLAAVSANAVEMAVSGASVLTYTNAGPSEVTGNPFGMKTNLSFTASGDVNGYTVSYMQTSADQFAGMSSARMSIDLGDMGTIAYDQGSGSGLSTIDDKTPTAGEEIWDGMNSSGTGDANGLVGASSSGALNYVNSIMGVGVNLSYLPGSATNNADGGNSGDGNGSDSWDVAITGSGSGLGMDGLEAGFGYGDIANGSATNDDHYTVFANYTFGMLTVGLQTSGINRGAINATNEKTVAAGIAANINDNLSVSYGKRNVDYNEDSANSANVQEVGSGFNIAYTMGSAKVLVTRNEVTGNGGTAASSDENTEVALSFAF